MKIFDNLMELCTSSDPGKFFYEDFISLLGTNCRIFSYNYTSYSDWLKEDALECRGIMFEIDGDGNPIRIMSRPMEKFFNLEENPMTIGLDLSSVEYGMVKADGSLVSTYIDNDMLFMKSKCSLTSDQALAATGIMNDFDNVGLRDRCIELAKQGFTLNFEYVSPDNRIVLQYQEKELVLLNVRHNETGEYIKYSDILADPVLRKYLVAKADIDYSNPNWVDDIRLLEGIEGFVFVMESGQKFKLKTEWYSDLHGMRDSFAKNEDLFETIVAGAADDIKALFSSDEYSVKKIEAFEAVHLNFLKDSLETIQEKYSRLTGKDRKTFAVTAQEEFNKDNQSYLLGVFMQTYSGGIDMSTIIDKLNETFIKNCSSFVPEEYKTA